MSLFQTRHSLATALLLTGLASASGIPAFAQSAAPYSLHQSSEYFGLNGTGSYSWYVSLDGDLENVRCVLYTYGKTPNGPMKEAARCDAASSGFSLSEWTKDLYYVTAKVILNDNSIVTVKTEPTQPEPLATATTAVSLTISKIFGGGSHFSMTEVTAGAVTHEVREEDMRVGSGDSQTQRVCRGTLATGVFEAIAKEAERVGKAPSSRPGLSSEWITLTITRGLSSQSVQLSAKDESWTRLETMMSDASFKASNCENRF